MPKKQTIQKYKDIIKSGKFTEQEIISFRSLLNNNPRTTEFYDLITFFGDHAPFELTWVQQEKGLEWLKNRIFTKSGNIRNTQETNEISNRTNALEQIAEMIKNFDRFEFADLVPQNRFTGGFNPFFLPVYRLYDKRGNFFDYTVSVGQIEIIDLVFTEKYQHVR